MKKLQFTGLLMGIAMIPQLLLAQSTEGKDFWVTLMQADSDNPTELSLTFSAKKAATVRVQNEYTMYDTTMTLADNEIKRLLLDSADCYVSGRHAETPVGKALHVTSDVEISVIAANYRNKSFDVAAILPTAALRSEYRIQCYPPSAHEDASQGTHFVIIAAEDNVEVDYILTALTSKGHYAGDTITTPKMQKGQAYYVWTGNGSGDSYDFSGTTVKARDGKKIAVFNGNVHTNIPSKIRDRDHIYSQAMPINYWGKHFAITSSLTTIDEQVGNWERIDKIRVQAVVDSTVVWINGDSVYTFDFATNSHHTYEFDFGAKDNLTNYTGDGHRYFEGSSHYIETSCPCAVHLFMTSNRYDHDKIKNVNSNYCNGDPSEIWVNPIEQKMTSMTFGNFETQQVKDHYVNIVAETDGVASMMLDNVNIANLFSPLNGNNELSFARIKIENKTHTMSCDSGFIAHVYGFGEKESYGYPAGGNTRDLSAAIYINGVKYTSGSTAKLCGDDRIDFNASVNYEYDSIYWYFGDGKDTLITDTTGVTHIYDKGGRYEGAYVKIFRDPTAVDECLLGMIESHDFDSIAFIVNIGKYKITARGVMPRCTNEGDATTYTIYLTGAENVPLDSMQLTFNQDALKDGFKDNMIHKYQDSIQIEVPTTAKNRKEYKIYMHIGSECPSSVLNDTLSFSLEFNINYVDQRFRNASETVLGIDSTKFRQLSPEPYKYLSDFSWKEIRNKKDTILLKEQQNSILHLQYEGDTIAEYMVCFTLHRPNGTDSTICSCPIKIKANKNDSLIFMKDSIANEAVIQASWAREGELVFVNALEQGTAIWYDTQGNVQSQAVLPKGGGLIMAPQRAGLYILKVDAGHQRTFKFLVTK